jgi:hypothetical protein
MYFVSTFIRIELYICQNFHVQHSKHMKQMQIQVEPSYLLKSDEGMDRILCEYINIWRKKVSITDNFNDMIPLTE